jgi:ketosteroid isomerase-like protein
MTLSAADRLDILDLVGRADAAATARNASAYVGLFTDDAILDGAQGRHAGQDALRAAVGPIWAAEGPATLHLTLNPVIDGADSDEAVVSSILLIIDPAAPFAIHAAAAITQTVRRTGGTWRIARRTVGRAGKSASNVT